MPDLRAILRACRDRRFLAVVAGAALSVATQFAVAARHDHANLKQEIRWLQGRLVEKRAIIAGQREELAHVASAVEDLVRTTASVRDHTVEARRLANMEEAHETPLPTQSSIQLVSASGDAVASDDGARTLQHLAWLEAQAVSVSDSVGLLTALLRESPQQSQRHGIPSMWPVRGEITSRFGERRSPYGEDLEMHPGIDIRARQGMPVTAGGDGKVVFAGRDAGYGRLVIVEHAGDIDTFYAHLSAVYVREGDFVRKGQVLAAVGSTGRATGAHLHYEVRIAGRPVDPHRYLVN